MLQPIPANKVRVVRLADVNMFVARNISFPNFLASIYMPTTVRISEAPSNPLFFSVHWTNHVLTSYRLTKKKGFSSQLFSMWLTKDFVLRVIIPESKLRLQRTMSTAPYFNLQM